MQEISHASAEQSTGVQEVGRAVTEMDQVTQQNAALVHESATAANSLRQNAHSLLHAMEVFKLPNASKNAQPSPASLAPARSHSANTQALPAVTRQQEAPEWESF